MTNGRAQPDRVLVLPDASPELSPIEHARRLAERLAEMSAGRPAEGVARALCAVLERLAAEIESEDGKARGVGGRAS